MQGPVQGLYGLKGKEGRLPEGPSEIALDSSTTSVYRQLEVATAPEFDLNTPSEEVH